VKERFIWVHAKHAKITLLKTKKKPKYFLTPRRKGRKGKSGHKDLNDLRHFCAILLTMADFAALRDIEVLSPDSALP
jgi:hypothetical protein